MKKIAIWATERVPQQDLIGIAAIVIQESRRGKKLPSGFKPCEARVHPDSAAALVLALAVVEDRPLGHPEDLAREWLGQGLWGGSVRDQDLDSAEAKVEARALE